MDREDIGRLRDVMLELAELVKESTELADKLLAEADEPAYPPTPGAGARVATSFFFSS